MDGLEAVEINLSVCKDIIDFRIDANTYKKNYIKSEKLISEKPNKKIEDLSISVQNFGAYSLCNFINFTNTGIPFLMTYNIRHNYIDWNIEKCVDVESHNKLYKSHCFKNQILVTMAGEYLGRVAVYNRDFVCSSNQAIAKITLKNGISPYMISTFLNSIHGQNQINRYRTITGQPNINMSLIKNLRIPIFTIAFQCEIENAVKAAHVRLEKSQSLYEDAEKILLKELGLTVFALSKKNFSIKSFSESLGISGRLDAEYYQPKYDELLSAIAKYNSHKLGDIVNIKKSIEPGSEAYQEEGIPFIRVSNISKFELTTSEIHLDRAFYEIEKLKPLKDTILLTKDGSVGIAYKVNEDLDVITSGAILHLTVKNNGFLPDYLTLVLNSIVVQLQAQRDAGGSIIQHWKPSEIEKVRIPILDIPAQQIITNRIQKSFALRKEAAKLLEQAKQTVEIAIEYGEESALNFLKTAVEGVDINA